MKEFTIVELTKDNEKQYLDKVVELEEISLDAMLKEGRVGQLFTTGGEDISEYIHSKENTVMIAVDHQGNVEAATYITQGQQPFTYNDITKYFKYGKEYQKYVKSLYSTPEHYKKDMLETYKIKIQAYEYAKKRILEEYPQYKTMMEFLEHELNEPENQFHEKSELRQKINSYMSEYIARESQKNAEIATLYDKFYWTSAQDIAIEFGKELGDKKSQNSSINQYEQILESEKEFDTILKKQELQIHEEPEFDCTPYYTANTSNAIELDTYLTNPNFRNSGLAKIIVYEGMKKHVERHFENPDNNEIFLCSTLHRDNLSSKYVSEFFGLKDSLYVKRRTGRDREVHICKIKREEVDKYLESIEDKLAVLYGYNPSKKPISNKTKIKVIDEQMGYEKQEFKRLNKVRKTDKTFSGKNVKFLYSKLQKIKMLQQKLEDAKSREGGFEYGD